MTSEVIRQRLIDPELCIACCSCYESCAQGAISIRADRLTIDPERCDACGACAEVCPTGAVNAFRTVARTQAYSAAEQLTWRVLPPEELTGEGGPARPSLSDAV